MLGALEDPRRPASRSLVLNAFRCPLSLAHIQHGFGFSYFWGGHLCFLFLGTQTRGVNCLHLPLVTGARLLLPLGQAPVIGPQGSELSAPLGPRLPCCWVGSLVSSLQEGSVNSQSELTHSAPPPSLYQEFIFSGGFC